MSEDIGRAVRRLVARQPRRTRATRSAAGWGNASGWIAQARISRPSTIRGPGREKYEVASTAKTLPPRAAGVSANAGWSYSDAASSSASSR